MCILKIILLLGCVNQATAGASITLKPSTYVAFAGETLQLKFFIHTSVNQSSGHLTCYFNGDEISRNTVPYLLMQKSHVVTVNFKMTNSSSSGGYKCKYSDAVANWAVLVRDEGYKEPKTGSGVMLPVIIFNVLLLVFSVAGSVYVFRGIKDSPVSTADGEGVGKEEESESDRVETDEDGPSSSVYTALEARPASVYDVLEPEQVNKTTEQKRKKKVTKEIMTQADPPEEGIFESVYENV